MLQNIKENFWLYVLVIAIVFWIITLWGCTKQPERFNMEQPIDTNLSKYCEHIRDDKEFESICWPYLQYDMSECIMLTGESLTKCWYDEQENYYKDIFSRELYKEETEHGSTRY